MLRGAVDDSLAKPEHRGARSRYADDWGALFAYDHGELQQSATQANLHEFETTIATTTTS